MKHRKIKSEIAFYLQNFDQIEYHEYVDSQTRYIVFHFDDKFIL